jgi:hypothetical protein
VARRPAAGPPALDNQYKRQWNACVRTAVASIHISDRMRMSSQAPRAGIPLPPLVAMTQRVPVLARFPWPGGTLFLAGAVIP